MSRYSSVSIVSDYGVDDWAIGVRSQAGEKDCSSNLCVQTGSEAHPTSCTMGTGGPFPGAKRGRGVKLTTHPHLVPRSGMSSSYTSVACSGTVMLCLTSEEGKPGLTQHFVHSAHTFPNMMNRLRCA
jgi:hypothetical protein